MRTGGQVTLEFYSITGLDHYDSFVMSYAFGDKDMTAIKNYLDTLGKEEEIVEVANNKTVKVVTTTEGVFTFIVPKDTRVGLVGMSDTLRIQVGSDESPVASFNPNAVVCWYVVPEKDEEAGISTPAYRKDYEHKKRDE